MNKKNQGFTIIEVIIVLVVIGIIGLVGWIYFSKTQQPASAPNQSTNKTSKVDGCKTGDISAENGIFCSSDIGVSMQVLDIFKGKIKHAINYDIAAQSPTDEQPATIGTSENVYEAIIKGQTDEYKLTIAKEPLRDFRIKSLLPAFFNKDTKQIRYTEKEGQPEVESTMLDGVKFYTYGVGDAGIATSVYLAVINNKIIIISLSSEQKLGNPETRHYLYDPSILINEFKSKIKSLKVV